MNNILVFCLFLTTSLYSDKKIECDLLIIGGTESGCSAAIQAARMGTRKIIIINDTDWYGGQFSSEGLVAIDENRGPKGYDQTVPFPRNGIFLDLINMLEKVNLEKFGERRPGNTRVISTTTPKIAHLAFKKMLEPFIKSGVLTVFNNTELNYINKDKEAIEYINFKNKENVFNIYPKIIIDSSDLGDVIKLSGNDYKFGPDLYEEYKEPLAPRSRNGYPLTDMNPITYCIVLEETDESIIIPKPKNYDSRNYYHNRFYKKLKSKDWLYESRRLVDSKKFKTAEKDFILINFPSIDYPLDNYPQNVTDKLEAIETGSSKKNIIQLNKQQRNIIFQDAKDYSLGFLYFLQTDGYNHNSKYDFRKLKLYHGFNTIDNMPPKPYIRESLRIESLYRLKQQDTTPSGSSKFNFSKIMFYDSVFSWQFEYDFHPTKRVFTDKNNKNIWVNDFRKGRTWGPPYSGKSTFPLRSLIANKITNLIASQKNVGFTSIVSSAIRLHDQSMAVGQASGALAAISINNNAEIHHIPFNRKLLMKLQDSLVSSNDLFNGVSLWPFKDLKPTDSSFVAANMLAVSKCFNLNSNDFYFEPNKKLDINWAKNVLNKSINQIVEKPNLDYLLECKTKGSFSEQLWEKLSSYSWIPFRKFSETDFDMDGVPNHKDSMPFNKNKVYFNK